MSSRSFYDVAMLIHALINVVRNAATHLGTALGSQICRLVLLGVSRETDKSERLFATINFRCSNFSLPSVPDRSGNH